MASRARAEGGVDLGQPLGHLVVALHHAREEVVAILAHALPLGGGEQALSGRGRAGEGVGLGGHLVAGALLDVDLTLAVAGPHQDARTAGAPGETADDGDRKCLDHAQGRPNPVILRPCPADSPRSGTILPISARGRPGFDTVGFRGELQAEVPGGLVNPLETASAESDLALAA